MKPKNNPETIEKERKVLELRRAGLTFDVIAQEVGYAAPSGAYHAFTNALRRTLNAAGSEELRELEADRLDRLQRFAWTSAAQGNLKAIETILRIMNRRARLLGLDQPLKISQEVTVWNGDGDLDREIQELIQRLAGVDGGADVLADSEGEAGAVTA